MNCGETEWDEEEIAASGTGVTKYFNLEFNNFIVQFCTNCGLADFYVDGDGFDIPDLPI